MGLLARFDGEEGVVNEVNRLNLEGVRRVSFWSPESGWCPEDVPFPSCLAAVLAYRGDTRLRCRHETSVNAAECPDALTACRYSYLMSLSGEAFAGSWNTQQWDMGNSAMLRVDDDPVAPIGWALTDLGYAYEILGNPAGDHDRLFPNPTRGEILRGRIVHSLREGRPVIAWGVVGPPEPCVITGYDDGGDVLIGWSFFQGFPDFAAGITFEPTEHFRKSDWLQDTLGVVLVGDKVEIPDPRLVARRALARGLDRLRTPLVRGQYASGIAMYDAWIDAVLADEEVVGVPEAVLRERHGVHHSHVGTIAELRSYGAMWLAETVGLFREVADQLGQASGCFAVEHDLMWRVWEQTGETHEMGGGTVDPAESFARRETREAIASVLRTARARDEEAAGHLEAALALIGTRSGREPNIARHYRIEGVPYIGFDNTRTGGKYKNTFMVAALESALTVLGEPADYEFLMGVSGAAFHLSWNAEKWDGGNISTLAMGDDPVEHYRRAFRAVGWDARILGNKTWREMDESQRTSIYQGPDYLGDAVEYADEVAFRKAIVENVRFNRYPVLAIGVTLLPECGIVFGYDEGGDVLIGWNHFQNFPENLETGQVDFEPDGAFRKRDWFADTVGLVLFQYKGPKPPRAESYRKALEWAVKLTRTPRFRQYHAGLAAYTAWATALVDDPGFFTGDENGLLERLMCHNDALSAVADGRGTAAAFLYGAASTLPEMAADVNGAAEVYEAEVATVLKMVDVLGGFGNTSVFARRLAEPEARSSLAALVLQAREQEETAIGYIEHALQGLSLQRVSDQGRQNGLGEL